MKRVMKRTPFTVLLTLSTLQTFCRRSYQLISLLYGTQRVYMCFDPMGCVFNHHGAVYAITEYYSQFCNLRYTVEILLITLIFVIVHHFVY